jgi:hypothetical protein
LINYNSLFSRQKRYLAHLKFLLFHAARRAFGRVDFLRMATGGFSFFRVGAAWMDGLSLAAAPPDLADLTRGDTAAPAAGHIVRRLNGFESQMTVDGAPQAPGTDTGTMGHHRMSQMSQMSRFDVPNVPTEGARLQARGAFTTSSSP